MTTNTKYYVGIDLGGTFIKGGVVDSNGEIILCDQIPTESEGGSEVVSKNIAKLALILLERCNLKLSDICGVGIGCPGMIDSKTGNVIYSSNLNWTDFNIANKVSELLSGIEVKVANDANVAALGEVKFGAAKEYDNAVMITLGTGVGSGIICDGVMIEGYLGAGSEFGHTVIRAGGEPCSCGRRGCFETYSSATALIRDTKRAMAAHPDSKMWEIGDLSAVTGKVSFDYAEVDPYAKEVVDSYIENLACGIVNAANIFRPQIVLLGGGVCAQGERLTKPLQELLDRDLFGAGRGPAVKIAIAKLGNNAGLLGAAALLMD